MKTSMYEPKQTIQEPSSEPAAPPSTARLPERTVYALPG
jgi:hypothetical protein